MILELGISMRSARQCVWLFLTYGLISWLAISAAYGESARQIAQQTFPSVVLLIMDDKNGQPLSLGSGFVVADGIVATNLHVIEGAHAGSARFVGGEKLHRVGGVLARDQNRDLVLLAVPSAKAAPLQLGDVSAVAVGDTIYSVGNPLGLEGTFSQGIVSGVRLLGSDTVFQITAPISHGSSGGPVLDSNGLVVGVATALIEEGRNLNFAIPSSYLASLLRGEKALVPLSTATRHPERKSVIAALGSKSVEAVQFTHFDWVTTERVNFSLKNRIGKPIRKIKMRLIYFDAAGEPVDFTTHVYTQVIPPKLAVRVNVRLSKTSFGRRDIPGLAGGVYSVRSGKVVLVKLPRVEFRMIDFEIVE